MSGKHKADLKEPMFHFLTSPLNITHIMGKFAMTHIHTRCGLWTWTPETNCTKMVAIDKHLIMVVQHVVKIILLHHQLFSVCPEKRAVHGVIRKSTDQREVRILGVCPNVNWIRSIEIDGDHRVDRLVRIK